MVVKDVLDEAVVFAQVETSAFRGDNSSGVLATVLEHREAVEEHLVDVRVFVRQEKSEDAAHDVLVGAAYGCGLLSFVWQASNWKGFLKSTIAWLCEHELENDAAVWIADRTTGTRFFSKAVQTFKQKLFR